MPTTGSSDCGARTWSASAVRMNNKRPAGFSWNYDRDEMVADGVIHVIGICFGLIGAVTLIVVASRATKIVAIESVFVAAYCRT
jgi:predicted membrane channel-forming protein YqfA (hemolysin III family)